MSYALVDTVHCFHRLGVESSGGEGQTVRTDACGGRKNRCQTRIKPSASPPLPSPRPSLDICLRNENEVAGAGEAGSGLRLSSVKSSAIWGRTVQYVTQEAADGRNEYRQASAPPLASPLPIQSYVAQYPEFRGINDRIGSILPYVPCLTSS